MRGHKYSLNRTIWKFYVMCTAICIAVSEVPKRYVRGQTEVLSRNTNQYIAAIYWYCPYQYQFQYWIIAGNKLPILIEPVIYCQYIDRAWNSVFVTGNRTNFQIARPAKVTGEIHIVWPQIQWFYVVALPRDLNARSLPGNRREHSANLSWSNLNMELKTLCFRSVWWHHWFKMR